MFVKIRLKPFSTPNFVLREKPGNVDNDVALQHTGGVTGTDSWPLKDIDPLELSSLCRQFRLEVFEKAGKPDPMNVGTR